MTMPKLASLASILLVFASCSGATGRGGGNTGTGGDEETGGGGGGSTPTGGKEGGTGGKAVTGGSNGGGTGGVVGGDGGSGGGGGGTGGGAGGTGGKGGSGGTGGAVGGSGGTPTGGAGGSPPPSGLVVATNRYDNGRSGWNSKETALNATNVGSPSFGLLFSKPVMGKVYNMPLFVGGVTVKGAKKNVVYVTTEHNMVYAFDNDDGNAAPLWTRMLEAPLPLPISGGFPSCQDLTASGEVGVTSTPAIDVATNKMYLVSKTNGTHKLHAIDLGTGDDVQGSPVDIKGMGFDSNRHLNRPGLLLQDGTIYIGFGSHCDDDPYHGWMFAYDAAGLTQTGMYNVTPNGTNKPRGAIWQSGMGLAGDDKGVYFCTGNGLFDGANAALSVLRLNPKTLSMGDRFTPSNAGDLNGSDQDLTAGVVFLGNTGLMVSGGKGGDMYLMPRNNLKAQKTIPMDATPQYHPELHNFAYMENASGQLVYVWPDGGVLTAYKLAAGNLTKQAQNTIHPSGYNGGHPGGIITLSSNGTMPGTAVAWTTVSTGGDAWHKTATGDFIAFDASMVSKAPLFREAVGNLAKFSPPMVANGKVWVATFSGKVNVYGLK
ncbi:MAG TPA: hypothetical protein VN914_18450 [Polyangia bacterium]|nr:hypothetical protein [Polyangia bacterium]